jgi:glycosyltransferase involved in cell wall biosynthesis
MAKKLIMNPTFSIITISYNNGSGLRRTLESIKAQVEKDFELIVIDGGSSDNSVEVIESYSEIVNFYVSEQDRGISHAFNKGTKIAKGKLVNYLNSGDTYIDEFVLHTVKQSYLQHNWPWAYGLRKRIDIDSNIYNARKNEIIDYDYSSFVNSNLIISHQSTFYQLPLVKGVGMYNENYQFLAMDIELLVRIGKIYKPYQFKQYVVLYEDFGISAQYYLKSLKLKHKIRVENLDLSKYDFFKSLLVNTYLIFFFGKVKGIAKKILLKSKFSKKILK